MRNGNDDSLYFSFWNGIDRANNTPNISITIRLNGEMYIWLNTRDSKPKADFFQKLALTLGRFTRTKNYESNTYENTWRRSYVKEGWRNVLTDFIKKDFTYINELVKKYQIDDLCVITKEEFADNFKTQKGLIEFLSDKNNINTLYSKDFEDSDLDAIRNILRLYKLKDSGYYGLFHYNSKKQITTKEITNSLLKERRHDFIFMLSDIRAKMVTSENPTIVNIESFFDTGVCEFLRIPVEIRKVLTSEKRRTTSWYVVISRIKGNTKIMSNNDYTEEKKRNCQKTIETIIEGINSILLEIDAFLNKYKS